MKILHVNMSLNRVSGGGTVERVLQIHRALTSLGVESHILSIDDSDGGSDEQKLDKTITYLPLISKRWFIPSPAIKTVKKLVKESDVVHLMNHWTFINAWVYILIKIYNKPYLICPAGSLIIFGRSKIKKHIYQWLVGKSILKNASAVIAISADEITALEKKGITTPNIKHLPNGVREDDFLYKNQSLFRNSCAVGMERYILFFGRINAIKGPDLLLEAYASVYQSIPHHLVYAGPDGGMMEELKLRASKLGLSKRIHFCGYLGGDLKSSAYHGAEFLVIPSRHEAMSIVALEAAITSTPVLLTDQCGFTSLANEGGAIEVTASVNGILEGLEQLLFQSCDLSKMGKRGQKFALDNYSWSSQAERFHALCCELV